MGVVEILLAVLCLNTTCSVDFSSNETSEFSTNSDSTSEITDKTKMLKLRDELEGKHLKVTTIQNVPLSYTIDVNGSLVGQGVAFELFNVLKHTYNFEYSVILPRDNVMGHLKENRFQSGVLGLLDDGIVDVVVAFLPTVPQFVHYVDYSTTIDYTNWLVLMNRPKQSASGTGILAPFTGSVWALTLVSIVVVGPIIHGFVYMYARLLKENSQPTYSIFACSWFVYGAILKQGSVLNPVISSTRLIFATWWIFITVITAFYTANLTAFLTLSQFTLPLTKSKDIGVLKYTWVTTRGSSVEEARNDPNEKLYHDFQGSFGYYINDNLDVLNKWLKGTNNVYLGDKYIVNYLLYQDYLNNTMNKVEESDKCTYVATTWGVLKRQRAFAYAKNFTYKNLFNYGLQHLIQAGLRKHLKMSRLPDTTICPQHLGRRERKLSISDLKLVYYLTLGGFLVAFLFFLGEIFGTLKNKFKKRKTLSIKSMKFANHKVILLRHFPVSTPLETSHVTFSPPPPYQALFPHSTRDSKRVRKNINGTDYWIKKTTNGGINLIPVHTPSAALFHRRY